MQANWKTTWMLAGSALVVGLVAGAYFGCSSSGNASIAPTSPVAPKPSPASVVVHTLHDTVIHYAQGETVNGVRVDTQYIRAPFWLMDTIRVTDTVIKQPKPFSLPGVFALATPIIAHLQPPEPVNVLELYVHADHDMFAGGYGGGAEFDLRLDQLHITPLILYADVGYDHSFHLEVGGRGKLWGAW